MELFNLLEVTLPYFEKLHEIDLDFIGKFIGILVGATGVGVGIILFSLILKLVVLPLDVFQRISMRKQNQKMKENQEEMEKLQKQYANDKDMYNQKVMEMYKKNGMSMFSSCLPMIVSMVIFFVAIGSFNSFSSYSNLENYNTLVKSYNKTLEVNIAELNEDNLTYYIETESVQDENGVTTYKPTGTVKYTVKTADYSKQGDEKKYFYYTYLYAADMNAGEIVSVDNAGVISYKVDEEKVTFAKISELIKKAKNKSYFIDADQVLSDKELEKEIYSYAEYTSRQSEIDQINEELKAETLTAEAKAELEARKVKIEKERSNAAVREYFVEGAQRAVKVTYDKKVKNNTDFFWIKNIWVTDAVYKHPVLGYKEFSSSIVERRSCSCNSESKVKGIPAYTKDGYATITEELAAEKKDMNGYFVLIALSIGTILLQQFVSMRSQKEQQKYSTVDGQGAGQQKIMMVVMTGMFAVFSFMYSSAFSIYLIISNVFSLLSTLIINKLVDKSLEKKAEKAELEKYNRRFAGRAAATKTNGKVKKVKAYDADKANKKKK